MTKRIQLIVVMLVYLTGVNFAGGFQLNEHGARAMAMGNAFTAIADDPSAIFWNGAGIAFLEGTQIMAGGNMIAPVTSFRGVYPSIQQWDMVKQKFTPPHFYATQKIGSKFAFGVGFTVPYGLGSEWDENWVGRYLAVKTDVMCFTVSPVIAVKLHENLSISAGVTFSWANVKIAQKSSQSPFAGDAFAKLEGKDNSAFGYNVGILFKPLPELQFGASLRSQIKYDFKGTAVTTGSPLLASNLPNGDITAELKTPLNVTVGWVFQPVDYFKFSFDYQFVGWSSYDVLAVDFADPKYKDIASPREYQDTYYKRFGIEYMFTDKFAMQGGVYYDHSPVSTEFINPSLPDADRLGFSVGLTYKMFKGFTISGSYLFVRADQTTVENSKESYTPGFTPFNGTYNSSANIGTVTLSYGF